MSGLLLYFLKCGRHLLFGNEWLSYICIHISSLVLTSSYQKKKSISGAIFSKTV